MKPTPGQQVANRERQENELRGWVRLEHVRDVLVEAGDVAQADPPLANRAVPNSAEMSALELDAHLAGFPVNGLAEGQQLGARLHALCKALVAPVQIVQRLYALRVAAMVIPLRILLRALR